MDNIDFYYQQNFGKKKKNYRRYIIIAVILMLGYFVFNLGWAYKKITVENKSNWDKIGNIFTLGNSPNDIIKEQSMSVPKKETDRLDILVLGIRGEDDENGGLLTDSIMLISLDKTTGQTAIISIPRDLYVNIKKIFAGKINEIYWTGLLNKRGFDFTKETFSRINGVYIDHIVVFNFQSFKSIVDSIGGIDVTLEKPFEEKQQWGYVFYLPEGESHLNGEDALYYVRSRYSTNDFDRARRQQQVIAAIKDKILSLGIIGNPLKVNSLITALGNSIKTDIGIWDINDLIDLFLSLNATDNTPKNYILTTENVLYDTTEHNAYILLPQMNDYKIIQEVFKNILK